MPAGGLLTAVVSLIAFFWEKRKREEGAVGDTKLRGD